MNDKTRSHVSETYPPLDAHESTLVPSARHRAGLHGPLTGGWLLTASVSQLSAVIAVLWCGLQAHPDMTPPGTVLLLAAMLAAHWLVSITVFALGRARFRVLERRYLAWLDGLTTEQRAQHCRHAQRRLLEHEQTPRHWVVPADW
ncbi:hypothetical protein EQW78_10790 [Oerskovia turbata]|uniref:Uncharacterized protein n=1 Tax=Oerskovia turbata TaxID=1713 RepID=A0A4V1N4Y4_9CELL|nr:hypothetical protein [Oerskovia turbata]RXR23754.1 hypothetical protein EQW73_14110 [Oerskovia turbata]RXR33776.1 hypothetical protein EQW78_10790 [Oerskovia turbata]TGJ96815.1 hypothetical protein DLJ96_01720 [Actinotalea fermentans ATCC 43279 = JCM 9966 = DSM 3133]